MGWKPTGGGGGASPLTTKGDLWGYDTADDRVPVGTDGQVLTADSAQGLGVKWASPASAGGLWAAHPQLPASPFIAWDGDLAGLSAVDITGTQTVTEGDGILSVSFNDQAVNDINCRLKAHSFSVGDTFAVPVRMVQHTLENFCMVALVFSDGTTSGANATATMWYFQGVGNPVIFQNFSGTLTNMATGSSLLAPHFSLMSQTLYLKLTYTASNSFTSAFSLDGAHNIWSIGVTPTLTPTHIGVGWTAWNPSSTNDRRHATFGPVLQVA